MAESKIFVHKDGLVEQGATLGVNTRVWAFSHVLPGAVIGDDCNICDHVFIENDVRIGDRVTVKSGVQLWDGVRLEDDVFVGPNVTFTNDKFPRSKNYPAKFSETVVRKGASIGANATLLPGIDIGTGAMVGAGAVVTSDVPAHAIVTGNPAKITGYVDAIQPQPEVVKARPGISDSSVAGVSLCRLKFITDLRGDLSVTDVEKEVPFTIKRIFWVYNVPSEHVRGAHGHRKLHEFLVCVKGSVSVVVDDGQNREELVLNDPSTGLHLPPRVWRSLYKYSTDAVLLVMASHEYDPGDYIRNYEEFQDYVQT
ncbi:MAG: isomerase [Xanthomonadales bacterium]|nr:isomerase [Xanthomonadales bacterium]